MSYVEINESESWITFIESERLVTAYPLSNKIRNDAYPVVINIYY